MKKIFSISVLLLLFLFTHAEQAVFRVYFFKGKIEILKSANTNWKQISQNGEELFTQDKIKLSKGSELIIFNSTGISLTLNEAKTYHVTELIAKADEINKKGLASAYLKYIWEELNSGHSSLEEYSKSHFRDKGGVSRGCTFEMYQQPYDSCLIAGQDFLFSWEKDSLAADYHFIVYQKESGDKKLFETTTSSTFLDYAQLSGHIKANTPYYWAVIPKGRSECKRNFFMVLSTDSFNRYTAGFREIFSKLPANSIYTGIMEAGYYEQKHLYMEAIKKYDELINEFSTDKTVRIFYAHFLLRINQKKLAEMVIQK